MEAILRQCSAVIAQLVEAVAIVLIAYGAAEAFANSARHFFHRTLEAGVR